MRITNSMLINTFIGNLTTNMTKLSDIQNSMTSGKKFAHISDDPVALIYSQQAKYKLSRLADYTKNVDMAKTWTTQAEAGTMEMNKILVSAYESLIDAATDIKNESDFTNISRYIGQLCDHVLDVLNTTIGDKYVYGGYNTTGYADGGKNTPPFTVDPVTQNLHYNGVDLTDPANDTIIAKMREDVMTFDVAFGTAMPVTVNGINFAFYDTAPGTPPVNLNIYNLLNDMYNALTVRTKPDPDNPGEFLPIRAEDLDVFISDLQKAQNHSLAHTADLGGRAVRLEILESRYSQDELNYTQMLSDAEDADLAEVIMRFSMAEAVYNASLSAGARIIQPTLMDFLR